MNDTKKELKFFSIPEWKKEEEYLREQHKNGWEFVNVSGIGMYHFKRCEPKDVIYQLDYNPDSAKQKEEYIKMFSDCGWTYLQDYAGYSYFCKAVSEMDGREEEIFSDNISRLDMIKHVFKERMLPLLVYFFLVIIPQLLLQSQRENPILTWVFGALFCLYIVIFAILAIEFFKCFKWINK